MSIPTGEQIGGPSRRILIFLTISFVISVRNITSFRDVLRVSSPLDVITSGNDLLLERSNEKTDAEVNTNIRSKSQIEDKSARASTPFLADEKESKKRMNVVVLYPDDWRHNSIGAENTIIKTPFLDSLAAGGIRFRHNCVTTSICWISRATLFTGQWVSRHQSYKLRCPHFSVGDAWHHSWPAMLQREGYFVGHVGKWQYHNQDVEARFNWTDLFEGDHWYERDGKDISGEDLARDRAIAFLNERPKDVPFAMTVAFYPPKAVGYYEEPGAQWTPKKWSRKMYDNMTIPEPYNHTHAYSLLPEFLQGKEARERWRQRFRTPNHYQEAMKNMYALITQVDNACKEIVDEIKKQGLYENTMVIFTTDNGMFHGSHGLAGKWYPYQESIRTPLIIHDPRMPKEKVGTVDDSFTLNVDLAETIVGAAGLKPNERMQGRDISDLYLPKKSSGKTAIERKPWRDEFFYEFTFMEEEYIPSSNALVRKKWKYIDWYTFNKTQLFDIENDRLELNDVKDDPSNENILAEMEKRMGELRDNLKEPNMDCDAGEYLSIQ